MKNYIKNLIPSFALTLACFGVVILVPFIFLALIPSDIFGTMTATQVAQGIGWYAGLRMIPLILFICALVAAFVAALNPFTGPRLAMDENGDLVVTTPHKDTV